MSIKFSLVKVISNITKLPSFLKKSFTKNKLNTSKVEKKSSIKSTKHGFTIDNIKLKKDTLDSNKKKATTKSNQINNNLSDINLYSLNKDLSNKQNYSTFFNIIISLKKVFKFIFNKAFFLRSLVISFIIVGFYVSYVFINLPNYRTLDNYKPEVVSRVFSEDGYILSELAIKKRSFIKINYIPQLLQEAFISAEDKTFYHNNGFNFQGIARAIINNTRRFFDHKGELMGGSTITQQLVKNMLLTSERTISRKIKEAILTYQVNNHLTKKRILELYLNEIYFGRRSYGVVLASLNYFNKSLSKLNLQEMALLAILPKGPNIYSPDKNYYLALKRRNWLINQMYLNKYITFQQKSEAISKPITLYKRDNLAVDYSSYPVSEVRSQALHILGKRRLYNEGMFIETTINNKIQKIAYHSLRNGILKYDKKNGYRGPIIKAKDYLNNNIVNKSMTEKQIINYDTSNLESSISYKNIVEPLWLYLLKAHYAEANKYKSAVPEWKVGIVVEVSEAKVAVGLKTKSLVNLDLRQNLWAYSNIDVSLKEENRPKNLNNFNNILNIGDIVYINKTDKGWILEQIPEVNGAILALNPLNGHILAMQGGFSYSLSKFNRAISAKRQPGSAFKPFVYLAALKKGMTPATEILDSPITFITKDSVWKPANDSLNYAGYITARSALEHSRNLASLRIAKFAGLNAISNLAESLGIYDDSLSNLGDAIGAKETTLLNMVRAYAIIANGGKEVNPVLIDRIDDNLGNNIYNSTSAVCELCNNIKWSDQNVPKIANNSKQIIDAQSNYILINMLRGVVQRGTGRRARLSGYDIAGKTGTTNDAKDLWFIGFTPQLVLGVYIGYDKPKSLGKRVFASKVTVPIFHEFTKQVLPLMFSKVPFRIPQGINMRWINFKTGKAISSNNLNAFLEAFRNSSIEKLESNNDNILGSKSNNNSDVGGGKVY